MRVLALAIIVVLVLVGLLWWPRNPPANVSVSSAGLVEQKSTLPALPPSVPLAVESSPTSVPAPQPSGAPPAAAPSVPGAPQPLEPAAAMPPPAPSDVEVTPEQIAADLDGVSLSLRDYRTLAAQNPVGTNLEITEALMGKNRTGARLAPQDARVNAKGEMVDRWGTPYFFHQMSATSMEIHSAGPDKRMGTDDDIIHQ